MSSILSPESSAKKIEMIDIGMSEAARVVLAKTGEDLSREGLLNTPQRFSKAMTELTQGYHMSVSEVVGEGVFAAEGKGVVSVRDVEFYSLCEHHMLPFWGQLSLAYIPDKKIVGLSKIPRIVDLFAKRFQVQERLTQQVLESFVELLDPKAVVVQIRAQHLCMMMRGVKKQSSFTVTEATHGLDNVSELLADRLLKSIES